MKTHIIAIGSITAIVTVLFLIVGPKKSVDHIEYAGNNYVQINSATWGLNCNAHVDHAIKEAKAKIAATPREERSNIEIPKRVIHNNALTHLSDLCNGKEICNFLAESDVIGLDPIYSCFKDLELSYRCFDIDRLKHVTIHQGNMARLDCTPKSSAQK